MTNAEDTMSLDAKTLQSLAEAGSDLSMPHEINHLIYFQDEPGARAAAMELAAAGFTVVAIEKEPDDTEWQVLARKTMIPRLKDVESTSEFFNELARRCRGDYDGWETKVQK